MAARWVGLQRPNKGKVSARAAVRSVGHAIHESMHALGAVGVLLMAAAMNFALYPNAIAAVFVGPAPISALIQDQVVAPPRPTPAMAFDEEDVHLLAATAWGEARSEGEEGMRAVAHVMVNRVGDRFGDTLKSVILAPKQFSAWNIGDPNRPLVQHPERYATGGENLTTWQTAQQVAREVLSGQSVDPTGGALFYHTRAVHPWWDRYGQGAKTIGAHVFYRDVPDHPGLVTHYDPNARVQQVSDRRGGHRATGPRAGRVHGVIQHAPAAAAHQDLPAPTTTIAAPTTGTF